MISIHTLKASPIGNKITPNAQIIISEKVPDFDIETYEMEYPRLFNDEAKKVVDLMIANMPGGLVDHIFAELALRKASIFGVRL